MLVGDAQLRDRTWQACPQPASSPISTSCKMDSNWPLVSDSPLSQCQLYSFGKTHASAGGGDSESLQSHAELQGCFCEGTLRIPGLWGGSLPLSAMLVWYLPEEREKISRYN